MGDEGQRFGLVSAIQGRITASKFQLRNNRNNHNNRQCIVDSYNRDEFHT